MGLAALRDAQVPTLTADRDAWWRKDVSGRDGVPRAFLLTVRPVSIGSRRRITSRRGRASVRGSDPATAHQRRVDAHFAVAAPYWRAVYDEQSVDGDRYRIRRARALGFAAELGCAPGTPVLEIGCGAGGAAVALARAGHVVYAVDTAPAMLALAHRGACEAGVERNIVPVCADARALPFAKEAFGIAIALGIVPWLPETAPMLREVRRVLRPAGHVIITADNRWRLNHVLDPRFAPPLAPLRKRARAAVNRLRPRRPPPIPWQTHSIREFDRELRASGLDKVAGSTLGFGTFSFAGVPLFSERTGVRIQRLLQALADDGWPLLRSLGSQYVALARKRDRTSR